MPFSEHFHIHPLSLPCLGPDQPIVSPATSHVLRPLIARQSGYHENCSDNLHIALQQALAGATNDIDGLNLSKIVAGLKGHTPDPLNLFMNIPWRDEEVGKIDWEPPQSKPGDYVELEAQRDLIVAMSACPQDIVNINGKEPVEAHYEVLD